MRQIELIRFVNRWRKQWLKRLLGSSNIYESNTVRWVPVYWWALRLKFPELETSFPTNHIKTLCRELSGDVSLVPAFEALFESHGTWLRSSLSELASTENPELVLDALYEASIGRDELIDIKESRYNVERKSRGAFYTPYSFARWVVAQGAPTYRPDLRIVDPACGSGAFLTATLDHYDALDCFANLELRAKFIEEQLVGFDLDADALSITRLRLSFQHWLREDRLLNPQLNQQDTLLMDSASVQCFDWVVGNPPWDKLIFLEREFFSDLDPEIHSLKTARERRPRYQALLSQPRIAEEWEAKKLEHQHYLDEIRSRYPRLIGSKGHLDKYLVFVEWTLKNLSPQGRFTLILPNAFYGTTSAQNCREFLLSNGWLKKFWGLSNASKIFDASPGLRFCVIDGESGGRDKISHVATSFDVDIEAENSQRLLDVPTDFILEDGCRLPELRDSDELIRWTAMKKATARVADKMRESGLTLYQELNMTLDSPRFDSWKNWMEREEVEGGDPRLYPIKAQFEAQGYLTVQEKGTFSAYNPWLKEAPRYVCSVDSLSSPPLGVRPRPQVLSMSRYWRLGLRATIHASESAKVVAALLPPGSVVGNSALTESSPSELGWEDRLLILGLFNARAINWYASKYMATNLNQHILEAIPLPLLSEQTEDEIRLCALGITLKLLPQTELSAGLPSEWIRRFRMSRFEHTTVAEMKSHIDELVDGGF